MNRILIEREHESIFQTYRRLPIVVERAEGCRIYDIDGNEYLDFLGGIAVNALGHSHPRLIEAMREQSSKYLHLSNYFYQEPQIFLAEKLKSITGMDKVFFSNSGTESIEGALKLTRFWGFKNNKNTVISFKGSFHGRTYGALSLMDKKLYKEDMGPFLGGIKIIPYNDINALDENIDNNTSGIFIECLQGESGIIKAKTEFIEHITELKNKYHFLLIADEIQSGTGRTGKFSAYEHYGLMPDIITLAKGIGGGLPLGAILARDDVAEIWEKGRHGTTFGGNALSCTAGLIVLDELQSGVMKNAEVVGDYFMNRLNRIQKEFPDLILEERGMGLMLGLLLSFEASVLLNKLLWKKVIANATSGNVLRLVPPLIINEDDVDEFCLQLIECLEEINRSH